MIELKNITKTYEVKGYEITVEALKGVSTVFPDHGMFFIVGKSGGGKSTLLNILGGLDTYDGGEMLIDGVSSAAFKSKDWESYRNSYAGFVFQDHHLIEDYTVGENVRLALSLQNEKDSDAKVSAALKRVGLEGYNNRRIKKISGGQRQRVAIARAIVKDFKMILADEPTGNLDPETSKGIFELLREISKDKLVVIVTHDVVSANTYADKAIILDEGRIEQSAENAAAGLTYGKNEKPNLRKSKLSNQAAWCIIGGFFKKHIVKVLFTAVICMLTLALFSGTMKFFIFPADDAMCRAIRHDGSAIVDKSVLGDDGYLKRAYFCNEDTAEIQQEFSAASFYFIEDRYVHYSYSIFEKISAEEGAYYNSGNDGICVIDEAGIKRLGFELIAGAVPNETWSEKDIAITKYTFELFQQFGYKEEKSKTKTEIKDYTDILGKNINDCTVKGIVDTHVDEKFTAAKIYADSKNIAKRPNDYYIEFSKSYFGDESIHKFAFTAKKSNEKTKYLLYANTPTENMRFSKFISGHQNYGFAGRYADSIFEYPKQLKEGLFNSVVLIAMLILLLVSAFILANFILSDFNDTKKEAAILRCMGARKKDVAKLYMLKTALLFAAVFALSLLLYCFAVMPNVFTIFDIASTFFPFRMFQLTLADVTILFGVLLLICLPACSIPLLKLLKKPPAELL